MDAQEAGGASNISLRPGEGARDKPSFELLARIIVHEALGEHLFD